MTTSIVYSAKVNAGDGFDAPVPLQGLPGWTVSKQSQTEIYLITHNLNKKMHVVATSMSPSSHVVVQSVSENSFTISAWRFDLMPTQTDFMFIATCKVPNAPVINGNV